MFRESGLTYTEIGLLLAIWAAAVAIFEIPSGVVADRWRRNGVVAAALVCKAIGFTVWLLWPSFGGFAVGFVLWGVQEAMVSGTTDALVYDTLAVHGAHDSFERVAGMGAFWARLGIILSIAGGGWLFARSAHLVIALSAGSMVVAAALALFLPDERPESHDGVERGDHSLRNAVRDAAATPGVVRFVVFGALSVVLYGVLDEFDFLYAASRGVAYAWLGVWGVVRFGLEAAGAALAARRHPGEAPPEPSVLLKRMVLAAGVLLTAAALGAPLVLYFAYYGVMAFAEVYYHATLQRRIASVGRATVSSVVSFVFTVAGMVLGLMLGVVADRYGMTALVAAVGVLTIAVGGLRLRAAGYRSNSASAS